MPNGHVVPLEIDLSINFDPDLFVNREKETQLFLDRVHARTPNGYLEFIGIAGQGKSEFLKWIYHQAAQEGYAAVYVDFEVGRYHRPEIYPILETIANQLSARFSFDPFASFNACLSPYRRKLQEFYRNSLENPQSPIPAEIEKLQETLTVTFNANLTFLLESHTIVFCLDSTEKRYFPAFQLFEDQILKPQNKHPNFLLVTAGQEQMVWKTPEIRDRVKPCSLQRLDAEAVYKQLQSLEQKKGFQVEERGLVLDKMLKLTLGHPFSTYKLIDFWTDEFKRPLTRTIVDDHLSQAVSMLIEHVIEARILETLQLDQEYPPVKDILRYLAPLRRIEFSTFKYALLTFLKEWFDGKKAIFFQKLMGEFQKTYIFTKQRLGSDFDLDPVVWNILLADMRLNTPDRFLEIQESLATYYDNLVELTRDATQVKNIVERLYHYATYLWETQPNAVNAPIQEALRSYLETYFTTRFGISEDAVHDQLNRLSGALEDDPELKDLIDVSELLRIIQDYRGEKL